MLIDSIAVARPNFMKIALILRALRKRYARTRPAAPALSCSGPRQPGRGTVRNDNDSTRANLGAVVVSKERVSWPTRGH